METPAPLGNFGGLTTGTKCLNCGDPITKNKKYCSTKCGNSYRVDQSYFGGKRNTTIGLAEKTCQVCNRKNVKGLSSHHVIGKENDADNDYLIALCRGCHQLVTILGRRKFDVSIWEKLIKLVTLRKQARMSEVKVSIELTGLIKPTLDL